MRTITLISIILFITNILHSQTVNQEQAKNVCKNWLHQNSAKAKKTGLNYKIKDIAVLEPKEELIYIFHLKPKGYVMVSADKRAYPVLSYSFNNNFDIENHNVSANYLIELYKTEIRYARKNKLKAHNKIAQRWKKFGKAHEEFITEAYTRDEVINEISPLLGNIEWGQTARYSHLDPTYNKSCPNNAATGCAATAMGQIMKYYAHPPHSIGSNTYYGKYGVTTKTFGNSYDWDNMPDRLDQEGITDAQIDKVAVLLYDCGLATDMQYGLAKDKESANNTKPAEKGLNLVFGYNTELKSLASDYGNDWNLWEQKLKDELNNERPILYTGDKPSSKKGHFWVIDGYKEFNDGKIEYHCNMGWEGVNNNYYVFHSVLATEINIDYSENHEAIFLSPAKLSINCKNDKSTLAIGETVQFDCEYIYNGNQSHSVGYQWNFGDGQSSSNKNPIHSYSSPGWYDVSLTVTVNDGGQYTSKTFTKEDLINVPDAQPTYYVSPTGTGTGTFQNPCGLQQAINLADNTDEIILLPGSYNTEITIDGKSIKLYSYNPDNKAILKQIIEIINTPDDVNVQIEDIDFVIEESQAIKAERANIKFLNTTVTSNNAIGIYATESNIELENCTISQCDHGIYSRKSQILCINTKIYENYSSILAGGITLFKSNVLLNNTLIVNNSGSDPLGGIYSKHSLLAVHNSTISKNVGTNTNSFDIYLASSRFNAKNSIIWSSNEKSLFMNGCKIDYLNYSIINAGNDGVGNIFSDPMFENSNNMNFHLQSCSPGIDAGDPESEYSNEPVPNGSRVNIGYYGNTDQATQSVPSNCNCKEEAIGDYHVIGNHTWETDKTIYQYIIIEKDATLTIKDATIDIEGKQKIIVKRGAKLILDNAELKSASGCSPDYWEGIEVWGNPYEAQDNPEMQGQVNIKNGTIIKDARYGILTCKRIGEIGLQDQGLFTDFCGGIVTAVNSSFCNNDISIYIPGLSSIQFDSDSYFYNCTFATDENYQVDSSPLRNINLSYSHGVEIEDCSFINNSPDFYTYRRRGYGIKSYHSQFDLLGNNSFENLYKCIYVISPIGSVNISNAIFTKNYNNIYVSNADNCIINNNTFNIGGECDNHDALGVYLRDCSTGYVQDNSFNAVDMYGWAGLIIDDCSQNFTILNNQFYNLEYAIIAEYDNTDTYITQNYFSNSCHYNIAITQGPGIDTYQGYWGYPASNIFSHYCRYGLITDIYNVGNNFYYFHNGSYTQKPQCYSSNIYLQQTSTRDNREYILSENMDIDDIRNNMTYLQSDIQNKKFELSQMVDGGNTMDLKYRILNTTSGKNIQLIYDLMTISPYLSEEMLIECIKNYEVFSDVILTNILVANPHSVKSDRVLNELDVRQNTMTPEMQDKINKGKFTFSQYEIQMAEINRLERRRKQLLQKMIEYYQRNNNQGLNKILEEETDVFYHYLIVSNYLKSGKIEQADIYLKKIPSLIKLNSDELDEYAKRKVLFEIQFKLNKSGKDYRQLSDEDIHIIRSISQRTTGRAAAIAYNMICYIDSIEPKARIILPEKEKRKYRTADNSLNSTELSTTSLSQKLLIYPNPSNGIISVKYKFSETEHTIGEIQLIDAMGRIISKQKISNNKNEIQINGLRPGIYFCNIIVNNTVRDSKKIVITTP